MGYRYMMPDEKGDESAFRIMEVVMVERTAAGGEAASSKVMMVDSHLETLNFVKDNMNDFVTNIIRMKKMNAISSKKIEESASLFRNNLQPLFSMISETSKPHILDKLSNSLKKALILMAMDRYKSDKVSICKALGISQAKLEKEMSLCGLTQNQKAA